MNKNSCYFSLAYTIGSLGLAIGSIWSLNVTLDRVTLQRGILLTTLGFVHFVSLTHFFDKYVLETPAGNKFRKKYRLMVSDVMEITNRLVSAIQAIYSFVVGLIVCKTTCHKSFVHASHALMEAYGWFGTAYFMYDIWAMYKVHAQKISDKLTLKSYATKTANNKLEANSNKSELHTYGDVPGHARFQQPSRQNDVDFNSTNMSQQSLTGFLWYIITNPVMIFHHIFIGTFGLLVITYIRGGGHCIYSYMFMMEFSTPSVSLRSILSTMGLKQSRLYVINGIIMIIAFFLVRVCVWPYVMWQYSVFINATLWQAFTGLPLGCILSILILFFPQVYWFVLMVKGAIKVLTPKKTTKISCTSNTKNNNFSTDKDKNLPKKMYAKTSISNGNMGHN